MCARFLWTFARACCRNKEQVIAKCPTMPRDETLFLLFGLQLLIRFQTSKKTKETYKNGKNGKHFVRFKDQWSRKGYKREREEKINSDKKYEGQRIESMSRNEEVENKHDHE